MRSHAFVLTSRFSNLNISKWLNLHLFLWFLSFGSHFKFFKLIIIIILNLKLSMEGPNSDLLNLLQQEKDWNMSCIFTDKEKVVADNGCRL